MRYRRPDYFIDDEARPMKNDFDIISDEELTELTGYKFPSKQCEALERAGVFFIRRPDGYPRTTWGHFNSPLSQRNNVPKVTEEQPDFGAM